jgi:hypothetical protein
MLNQCLDQEDRAAADLSAFVEAAGAWPVYAEQVSEAKRRLRGLAPASVQTKQTGEPEPGGLVLGASLLGAGAVFGGLSGWQGGIATQAQADWDAGGRPWAELEEVRLTGLDAAGARSGLLVGAIGLGLGGAVALVITATTSKPGPSRAAWGFPTASPLPDGGAAFGWAGRW